MVNQFRQDKNGGGMCIYIHNSINFLIRKDLANCCENIESLSIEVINKTAKNIVIIGTYRPPSGDKVLFENKINEIAKNRKNQNKSLYLIGDINFDCLKFRNDNATKNFYNMTFQNNLIPLITRPTRVTQSSATSIDQIFTNSIFECETKSGIFKTDISDHFLTFALIKQVVDCEMNEKIEIQKRDFRAQNIAQFKEKLKRINWNDVINSSTANHAYNAFFYKFKELYDRSFPLQKINIKKNIF